ncbi:flagellar motor switch protein FliN [Burkholderia sp. BE17]|uniref:flagellar motor switch protein FliN n=1 Tax=Burkholderia sp. BE17 TaxID=2656644 RepID=UPI00128DC4A0|nr:flagellar motor switch protein FliN [Burkholderia sp. BE17]MPV70229.1 flagellar motor switch protein FliN [Burkholderia sp. BE17]
MTSTTDLDLSALDDLSLGDEPQTVTETASPRDPLRMLRRIPVRLTLEVGEATVPLADLLSYEAGSTVELNRLAGEPLVIKVNGTPVGSAEVVVSGEHYGLRIVELDDLNALTT